MFKKKSKAFDVDGKSGYETVVTETVESADGMTRTTTKTTVIKSGDMSSSDFESVFNDFKLSENKRIICSTEKPIENSIPKKSPKQTKSLSERLGLKPKSNTQESPTKQCTVKPGKFEDDCLKTHNDYRKKHGVPPLKLSKQLCAYSKEWAEHLAATDKFQHRTERKYGENIFMKWSSNPNHVVSGNEAVDSWYSEIKDYTFAKEPTTLKSGHFTQVIWKESSELGVAWARSATGKILVVANYNPPGNFVGKFTANVPQPK